jgi:hypothetical protein
MRSRGTVAVAGRERSPRCLGLDPSPMPAASTATTLFLPRSATSDADRILPVWTGPKTRKANGGAGGAGVWAAAGWGRPRALSLDAAGNPQTRSTP